MTDRYAELRRRLLMPQLEHIENFPDALVDTQVCGPGTSVYIPSMEPHGMKNLSQDEVGRFLCCIANVYEDEEAL